MRESRLRQSVPIALGLVLFASVGFAPPASSADPTLVLTPASGPTGQVVAVSGVVTCPDVATGGEIHLGFWDPSEGFQTGAPLGSFPKGAGGTIQASVTIPSTMSQLRPGEGTFDGFPVTPGAYEIDATCSVSLSGDPNGGSALFTVTATQSTTSTSTSTTSTSTTSTSTSTTSTTAAAGTSAAAMSSATQVIPGQALDVTAAGFAPNSTAALTFESDPIALGTATADASGTIHAHVTVPQGVPAGAHHVVATGVNAAGGVHRASVAVTVSASTSSTTTAGLARTGTANETTALVAGLLIGLGLLSKGTSMRRSS